MKSPFKIGTLVQSNYRNRWKGIVIDFQDRSKYGRLCKVLLLETQRMQPIPRTITMWLDSHWLSVIKEEDFNVLDQLPEYCKKQYRLLKYKGNL